MEKETKSESCEVATAEPNAETSAGFVLDDDTQFIEEEAVGDSQSDRNTLLLQTSGLL